MLLSLKAIHTHLADAATIQQAFDKLEGDGRHTAFITHSSDNSSMVINEINPLAMTEEESLFLGKLLDEYVLASKQYLFQAGCNLIELKHPKTEKMMTIELNLKYPLLRRECEGNPLDYRYEIIGDELGSGSFSTVYKSKGVLAPQIDGSLQLKKSNRVIKVQDHSDDYPVSFAANEYENGKLTPHLHVKKPVLINNNTTSFSVIHCFSGHELLNLLMQDRRSELCDTNQRLLLSLKILKALREQIQIRGIIHQDIKPENLIVYMEGNEFEVNVIDLGSSKQRNKANNLDVAFTPPYAAPENYEKTETNEATDVYSISRVLGLLWHSKFSDVGKSADQDTPINYQIAYEDSLDYQFEKIFRGINLEDKYKNEIQSLLIKMCDNEQSYRSSLDDAIEVFERIIAERKLGSLLRTADPVISKAHTKAIELRRMVGGDGVKDPFMMVLHINSALGELIDDPVANNEFINTLGIRALQGLQTHAEIKKELSTIIKTHNECLDQLSELMGILKNLISQIQLKKPLDNTLEEWAHKQCAAINHKINSIFMITIDDMVVSNQRLCKLINNTSIRINYLNSEVDKLSVSLHENTPITTATRSVSSTSTSLLSQNSLFRPERDITVMLNGKVLEPIGKIPTLFSQR